MFTWLLFIIPYIYSCDYTKCYSEQMQSFYKPNPRQEFSSWLDNQVIKWYCLWCKWSNWYYDCSAFISKRLTEKWILKRGRLNSYMLAHYWIKKNLKDMLPWDLIVWQWEHNHVMTYVWMSWNKIIIKDFYKVKKIKERVMPVLKWVTIYYINNPYYGFKKDFYKFYKHLLNW